MRVVRGEHQRHADRHEVLHRQPSRVRPLEGKARQGARRRIAPDRDHRTLPPYALRVDAKVIVDFLLDEYGDEVFISDEDYERSGSVCLSGSRI